MFLKPSFFASETTGESLISVGFYKTAIKQLSVERIIQEGLGQNTLMRRDRRRRWWR